MDDGKVWCWGDNAAGQLGDGSVEDSGYPVWVRLPRPAIDVSAGYSHTCAILEDGSVYCWGSNIFGQSVPTSEASRVLEPKLVSTSASRFVKITCGYLHTCALTTSSKVFCWGRTTLGECGIDGDASGIERTPPVEVPKLDRVHALESGLSHTCALRSGTPSLVCWGSNIVESDQDLDGKPPGESDQNRDGKLGPEAGDSTHTAVPLPVDLGFPVLGLGIGYESTYAVTVNGITYAWGSNARKQLGTLDDMQWNSTPKPVQVLEDFNQTGPLRNVREIVRSGGSGACVNTPDPTMYSRYFCWGSDDHGELGLGAIESPAEYAKPVVVLSDSAGGMAKGKQHTCVTVDNGSDVEILCYGLSALVGNGTTDHLKNQLDPMPIKWKLEAPEGLLKR